MSYYEEEETYEEEEQYEEEGYYGPDDITIQSGCTFKNKGISGVINNALGTKNGMFTIYRRKEGKRVKIEGFETRNNPNARMINAVTGIPYFDGEDRNRYRVGTVDEDELFKVKFLSGENKTGPLLLFYDNPEQYERHQCVIVSTEMKEKWAERQ